MQTVSNNFREQEYSGEALFNTILRINNSLIPVEQIASIKIKSPIIDTSTETFYIGTFISQTLTIKFKNLDGLDIQSKYNVHLEIGQSVDDTYTYLPMGEYLIDDLAENYQTTCEITCMDYAVKFKPNIDYSPCFTNGIANVDTIAQYICNYFGVELGTDLSLLPNSNVVVGTFDSTISGKQWLSYIGEIKGCNLKMSRYGKLLFIPFVKDNADIEINALKSEEWELGEKYELSRIVYFDAVRNYTFGNDTENTLFIRQDNPFVTDESVINNLANNMLFTNKETNKSKRIEINDGESNNEASIQLYGDMMQETTTGKNLYSISDYSGTFRNLDITVENGIITLNGTSSGSGTLSISSLIDNSLNGTYTLSTNYVSGTMSTNNQGNINLRNASDNSVIQGTQTNLRNKQFSTTFTLNTGNIVFGLYIMNNITFDNFKIKPQLELGSEITEYEPFTYGASPNPNYPQEIKTVTGLNTIIITNENESQTQSLLVDLGDIELCKIDDYQDYIYKENNIWYKMSNILKINNYNGEIITTNYKSTTGQLSIGATIYYVSDNPAAIEITDTNLISQLEMINNFNLYDGINIISTLSNNLTPYLKLNYYKDKHFVIWSLKNKNYGDISLDAWDIIQFNLGDEHYWTYNDNELTYEMNISTTINTQIPTKQQEITTNVVGGDEQTKIKMLKTTLDYINNRIELLLNETDNLTERTNQLVLDILSTQNIFQITGGSNLIQNSQFLYSDDNNELWALTDNGSNPYNNLGDGYDAKLIGKTTSVSKIKLRDIILTSTSENIINIKKNQTYNISYSYTQDELTTTRVQLIEETTGAIILDKTYNEQVGTITDENLSFVANDTSYIFKVTTSTTSGSTNIGYFNLYDLMLNSGDKQNWTPAKSEVYSTVVKMSQMGLSIFATGSNIVTLLTSQGFQVRKYANGQIGVIITDFTDTGIITGDIESNSISTGKYISTKMTIGGVEHHVEYFKE